MFRRRRHHLPKLEELALANCGTVEKRDVLRQHLAALDSAELSTLVCSQLRYRSCPRVQILCVGAGGRFSRAALLYIKPWCRALT